MTGIESITKRIRLTAKEIKRAEAGVTVAVRQQSDGGYLVFAVRVVDGFGEPMGSTYAEYVENKMDISWAAQQVGRWLSKMGCDISWADATRTRKAIKRS